MYEAFFGLRGKPFSLLPDPDFLYLSKKHQEALTILEYGLLNQAGFIVLTGDVGSGKTTLMRYLLEQLDTDVTVGLIANTHESLGDLIDWICQAFGIHNIGSSRLELQQRFIDFLIEEYSRGRRTLLIVDEAQNLGLSRLEELRLLSNINADKDLVLQLMLLGQPQLRALLRHRDLEQFAQRVGASYHLGALTARETGYYIQHRVAVAGGEHELFTPDACDAIYHYSKGIPRLINLIGDTALVYAYGAGQSQVTQELVDEFVASQAEHLLLPIEREGDSRTSNRDKTLNGKSDGNSAIPHGKREATAEVRPESAGSSADHHDSSPTSGPHSLRRSQAQGRLGPSRGVSPPGQHGWRAPATQPLPSPRPSRDRAQAPEHDTHQPVRNWSSIISPEAAPIGDTSSTVPARDRRFNHPDLAFHEADGDPLIVNAQAPRESQPPRKRSALTFAALLGVLVIALWLGIPDLNERIRTAFVPSGTKGGAREDVESTHPGSESASAQLNERSVAPSSATSAPASTTNPRSETKPQASQGGEHSSRAPADTAVPQPAQSVTVTSPHLGKDSAQEAEVPPVRGEALGAREESERKEAEKASDPTSSTAFATPKNGASAVENDVSDPANSKTLTITDEGADASVHWATSADDARIANPPPNESAPSTPDESTSAGSAQQAREQRWIAALEQRLNTLDVSVARIAEGKISADLGKSVQFTIGNTGLDTKAEEMLTEIASVLDEFENVAVHVVGHTDARGRPSVNEWLSAQRAATVARFLSDSGVAIERLSYEGRGENELKVDAEEERLRGPWINRRIELEIYAPTEPTSG